MTSQELRDRTKIFALKSIKFFNSLPKNDTARILGKQFLRCSTSVAANYRAACRARSQAEFFSKLCIVVEEADESIFWLELLKESGIMKNEQVDFLLKESNELIRIFASSRKTLKDNMKKSTNKS